ncbi:MAG: hypothetical protein K2X93_15020 [Candidatus Obscuribacterales bacterium]|nr:hypothetical protein [Candidatus Obscuribacterales bacterium]
MYKLSFIKFPIFGILALLLFGSAVVFPLFPLPQVPQLEARYSMHIAAVVGVILGSALVGSILFYLKSNGAQKWQAFWGMIAFVLLYAALGNALADFLKIQNLNVEFNLAQMVVVCVGGILTTLGFWKLEPVDQFGTGTATLERFKKGKHQPEPSVTPVAAAPPAPEISLSGLHAAESAEDFMKQKGSSIKGLTSKTDLSVVPPQEAVMAKKTTPSSVESAQAIMTPPVEIDLDAADEMLSGPLNASPNAPAQQPASTQASPLGRGLPDEKRPAPVTTSNRLQAQKRRNTSTFTKLQALSASGTGSLKPGPQTDAGTGGGDLRSLLDRLDSEPESDDYETIAPPDEIRVSVLFAELEMQKSSAPGTPSMSPTPAQTSKPSAPAQPTGATASGATSPAAAGPQDSKLGGLAARMQQKKTQAPAGGPGGPKLASLLDRAEALAEESPTADAPAKPPAVEEFDAVPPGKPPAVEEFDAAPPSRDQSDSDLLSKRLMEISTEEDEVKAPAQSLTGGGAEPTEEKAENDKVFAEDVDSEVDDIFSNLASEEAQREVKHDEEITEEEKAPQPEELEAAPEKIEHEAEPVEEESPAEAVESQAEPTEEEEEEEAHDGPLFAAGVDGDVDDLFDNLAPAESQRDVSDRVEPAQEQSEEETVAEETQESSEGPLFSAGVDNDVDDLFDNLAPAESQREVGDRQAESEDAEPTAEIEAAAASAEEETEGGPLFSQGVDGDVDNLFDNLAPAESQREVGKAAEPTEEESAEGEGPLFAAGVDGDVDDLFDNLAPAEAQKTVEEIRTTKETQAEDQAETESQEPAAERQAQDEQELTGEMEPAEEAEPAADSETLFQLGDSDVDDIFAGLAGSQLDVNAETLMKVKPPEQEMSVPSSLVETGDRIPVLNPDAYPKTPNQTGDMPSMSSEQAQKVKESALEAKAVEPASAKAGEPEAKKKADADEPEEADDEESIEVAAAPKESPEATRLKKELKEFGKLSGKSAAAPKVVGENVGTMKTIGKLLIDNQAIENIIKAGEQRKLGSGLATARVISTARGQGIMDLLHKIDTYEGVVGSLIVGHDGLVMASTLKEGWDKDMMGALSTALLSTSNLTTKKLEIGKLRQMVMLTHINNQDKTTVLTDVDVGILAVFLEQTDITKIDGLLDIIHKTIHG